eukprot:3875351-Ditylum_brightwellii.AAC.1
MNFGPNIQEHQDGLKLRDQEQTGKMRGIKMVLSSTMKLLYFSKNYTVRTILNFRRDGLNT